MNLRDFVIEVHGASDWGDAGKEALLEQLKARQEEVAALLVARGWAERDRDDPCSRSIRLRSLNQCTCVRCGPGRRGKGYLYVTEAGEILSGHTKREARPVGPQTRRRMLGGDA